VRRCASHLHGFQLSTSGRRDGTIEAVYIRLSNAKVARTEEVSESILLADYDARGRLVGIEVLAPVRIADLARMVDDPVRGPFRKFVKQAVPEPFVIQG